MDKKEAERRFKKADKLFTYGRYEDVLTEVEVLEQHYPDNHRVLNAKARTLERLDRLPEALAVCDRLLDEFNYEKIRGFRDGINRSLQRDDKAPQAAFWGNETAPAVRNPAVDEGDSESGEAGGGTGTIIRVVLLLLIFGGLAAGMYFGHVPYWLGGGIIGLYVAFKIAVFVVKKLIGRLIMKAFSAPFKAKGKALAGATCQLHGYEWTDKPAGVDSNGADDDDEEDELSGPRRYVWLDVTITPPQHSEGFTHWEPGELMLAPLSMQIDGMDALEACFPIHDYKLVAQRPEDDTEDYGKFAGPLRLRILASIPLDQSAFKFAYYFEQFGELHLTD